MDWVSVKHPWTCDLLSPLTYRGPCNTIPERSTATLRQYSWNEGGELCRVGGGGLTVEVSYHSEHVDTSKRDPVAWNLASTLRDVRGVLSTVASPLESTTPCFPVHAALSDTHHTVMKVWHDGQQSSRGVCRLMTSRVHCWESISPANWGSGVIPRPVRVSLFWPMQQTFGRFVTVDEMGRRGRGRGVEYFSCLWWKKWPLGLSWPFGVMIAFKAVKVTVSKTSPEFLRMDNKSGTQTVEVRSWFILYPEILVFVRK